MFTLLHRVEATLKRLPNGRLQAAAMFCRCMFLMRAFLTRTATALNLPQAVNNFR